MSLRLSALRMGGLIAFLFLVCPSCKGVTVEAGEGTSGDDTSTGSTSGEATSTGSGSGGGDQGASSSGAGVGSVDAGCGSDGGGYPDGGGPLQGSGSLCFLPNDCPGDEFCWFVEANCGSPAPGTMVQGMCKKRPIECTNVCPVVCGCDGKWYWNECQANAAGYSIGSTWRCPPGGMP